MIANEQSIESCTVAYLVVFRDLNTVHPGVYVQLGERQTPCLGRLEGAEGALAVVPQPGEGVQAAASIPHSTCSSLSCSRVRACLTTGVAPTTGRDEVAVASVW